ncbi:MAG TPA: hypothetical protein VFO76_06955 [Candidatus Kapabacteria bacterium]|nr:hypothetical protein [Candidatus Kapabacteria bacterium]
MKKVNTNEAILVELTNIKKLLIFALLQTGSTQIEVASALGVDNSVISRMLPLKKIKMQRKKKYCLFR